MKQTTSNRAKSHAAMLKEALARPGVREYMEVYRRFQKADEGINPYRAATAKPVKIVTTDHANSS
ncbi:MAG: hypothetical protein OD918_02350 [Gammaproteobacteria bacterium]